MTTAVWLVRHAPTAWTGVRWCGRADPPLGDEGRLIARRLAAKLAAELPLGTAVWTSPARRARATAEAIAHAAGLDVTVDPELIEVDVGRVEGLTWVELSTGEPRLAAAILSGGPVDWPGGESATAVSARAGSVASRLKQAATGRAIVVVSHGAFLHAVAAELLRGRPGEPVPEPLAAGAILRLERVAVEATAA